MAITFDGITKRITLSVGTVTLSCTDLWSRYVDWLVESDNSKYLSALRTVGRDEVDIPLYVFVNDVGGWAIVPQSANHTLTVIDGILKTESGPSGDPFTDPAGSYKIRINRQAPGIAIGYSTTGGSGPTAADIAAAVRAEIALELARIDAAISSRSTVAGILGATLP